MAKMRSIALHRYRCVIAVLMVRTAAASESTPLPLPSDDQSMLSLDSGAWRVILALAVVMALVLTLQWFLRWRRGHAGVNMIGGSAIEIVERKSLGPRHWLLLVRVGKRGVLLHQGKGTLSPLCEIDFDQEDQEE